MVKQLLRKIESKRALIGVLGLGYVGLPLVREFIRGGVKVLGFDVDARKVKALQAGRSYIEHIPARVIREMIKSGRFSATTDFKQLRKPDCILICVPTPLSKMREPDLTYVEATARTIARTLRTGQLVVLESTTYPGTTKEVMLPILAAGGLKVGKDFFLAFSLVRVAPVGRIRGTFVKPFDVGARRITGNYAAIAGAE